MKRIASFEVNHDLLTPGMYTSRIDGDITTYDVRMVTPNGGVYLEPAASHTFEHLFATYVRNSDFADQIIYAGPMGCQTGFYFLVRDMKPSDAIRLVQETMDFVVDFTGDVPGVSRSECGNYCTTWKVPRRLRVPCSPSSKDGQRPILSTKNKVFPAKKFK